MTQEQLRQLVRFCQLPLLGHPPRQHRRALRLIVLHLERRTAARWLPDILYAHGLPRYARAADEILSR